VASDFIDAPINDINFDPHKSDRLINRLRPAHGARCPAHGARP
jgi:hypothetical protein